MYKLALLGLNGSEKFPESILGRMSLPYKINRVSLKRAGPTPYT